MQIVYIHGHRSTPTSFNFIRMHLSGYQHILLDYNSSNGFYRNHEIMLQRLENIDDIFFVAHSLGGLHALHLADELAHKVRGAVTISTPYGGSEAAEMLAYVMPFSRVLHDIHPKGTPVARSKNINVVHPWTNLVSVNGGSPLLAGENDGVVTLQSMRYRNDMKLIEVDSNHFEILMNYETIAIIRRCLRDIEAAGQASKCQGF